jgi:hypothetical protein
MGEGLAFAIASMDAFRSLAEVTRSVGQRKWLG